jgi:hypothetical protein
MSRLLLLRRPFDITSPSRGFDSTPTSERRRIFDARVNAATLAVIVCLIALVSLRSLSNGFVFDDVGIIQQNHLIGQWSFIWKSFFHDVWWFRNPAQLPQCSYYRPLQNLWFALGFHLFGYSTIAWHAFKILLNLAVVLLAFRAAVVLSGDVTVGLLAALLFGVLPAHVEVVAWISAIPEPLAAGFELAAFCLAVERPKDRCMRLGSVACFVAALFSFEGAIVFPVLLGAYLLIFGERAELESDRHSLTIWQILKKCAPYLVACVGYLIARYLVMGLYGVAYLSPGVGRVYAQTVRELFATTPEVMLYYIAMLGVPWLAGPAHPLDWVESFSSPRFYVPVALLLLLAMGSWLAARRSPRRKLYLFCAIWFFVSIAPMMNLGGVWDLVQDRYLYLPAFGWCVIAADCLVRWSRSGDRILWSSVAALILIAWSLSFWKIEGYWKDQLTMYKARTIMAPRATRWHSDLYLEYMRRDDFRDSEHELEEMLRLKPSNRKYHFLLHRVEDRLGNAARSRAELMKSMPEEIRRRVLANPDEVRSAKTGRPEGSGEVALPTPVPPARSAPAPAQ